MTARPAMTPSNASTLEEVGKRRREDQQPVRHPAAMPHTQGVRQPERRPTRLAGSAHGCLDYTPVRQ